MLVKVGTRRSKLALRQANIAIDKLKNVNKALSFEIHEIITTGDILYKDDLSRLGGKGLFLKEIESELLNGNIDIAVHSMKDVPVFLPEGLIIDCILEREDPREVLISKKYNSLQELPKNAVVGTSSLRRRFQVLKYRNDLQIIPLRGNVTTRIYKVMEDDLDACILAYAGIKRLGLTKYVKQLFNIDEFLPAVGQGAIGVERREKDNKTLSILKQINNLKTFRCIQAERSFMKAMGGDCTMPLAAYAIEDEKHLHLKAQYFDESGRSYETEVNGGIDGYIELGEIAALTIKSQLSA